MSNALTIFDPSNVPDHIKNFNAEHTNIGDKISVDSLTYKGKVFTVAINGNKTPLMKATEDGDSEPRTQVPLIILDYNKRRGRSWYSGGYEDDKPKVPDCWSPDGITSDPSSPKRQVEKCANCPLAVKGSKTTDAGTQTTACQQFRMVAVQLYRKWELPPLRLRLAITSDYDGQNKEQEAKGWYAFQQLMDLLRARGVKHTGAVVVKAKFDPSKAYPKLLFSPTGWTTEDELEIIAPLSESDEVKQLLSPTFTPNGGDGARKDQAPPAEEEPDEPGPTPAPVTTKPKATGKPVAGKPKPAPAPVEEPEPEPEVEQEPEPEEGEGEAEVDPDAEETVEEIVEGTEGDEEDPEAVAAAAAAAAQQAAQEKQAAKVKAATDAAKARKAAAAAQPEEDEEGDVVIPAAPAKPKAPAATTKAPAATTAAPKAAATTKAPAAAPKAPAATTKPATTKAPAAGSPKPVSAAVASTLNSWEDD